MVLFSLTEAPIAKSTVDKMQGKIPEGEVDIHKVVGLSHCIQVGRQSLPDNIIMETLLCNSVIVKHSAVQGSTVTEGVYICIDKLYTQTTNEGLSGKMG